MKDLVYIYNKSNFTRQELGEIQTNFNLSPVIDGTKDSAKIIVYNYSEVEVEPNSIIKHKATNTWWVVKHDKVERYINENGYWYRHNLDLLGAIDLLSQRDLTDSGFNQNRYTIQTFFARLLKHSNFEFKSAYQLLANDNVDLSKNVDYVKTYENYTLLSAIRDFINAYNCDIKLSFSEDNNGTINGAFFNVISKTGNMNSPIWEEDIFNNVQETKTMDKESFGTTVISNAENVISNKAKTYPSTGAVKISGTAYNVLGGDNSTAVIRLPSNIFRVNYVDMFRKVPIQIRTNSATPINTITNYYSYDDNSKNNAYEFVKTQLRTIDSAFEQDFIANFPINKLSEYGRTRIPYTDKYDPITKLFTSDMNIPMWDPQTVGRPDAQLVVTNSELTKNVDKVDTTLFFERGKNLIEGIRFFGESGTYGGNVAYLVATNEGLVWTKSIGSETVSVYIGNYDFNDDSVTTQTILLGETSFIVNYIPMADLKIKVDNNGERKDSKLYNQNGKLTDSVALSKSLLSYSKEIESDTITKYGTYLFSYTNGVIDYNFPNVGDLVDIETNNIHDLYVVNNISLEFSQHEDTQNNNSLCYYVSAEFTLSKQVATKSLMVNPNTNIRDYGIPQDKNVARKQLYRDFYELGHSQVSSNTNWYLPLDKVLNVGVNYSQYQEHIAIIKLEFNGAFGGSPQNRWFYQLESTTFVLKKSIYEVIDFRDNNIIGYGNQNVWSGFDVSRLLGNTYDLINTPISYVDDNGEFKSIELCLCTNEKVGEIYDNYKTATGQDFSNSNYGAFYSCFIPSEVYGEYWDSVNKEWVDNNYGAKNSGNHDFMIIETDYEKDALEVPVFEYSCQIDDSNQVIVGSNILDNYETDSGYLYQYLLVEKNKYNDNNYGLKKNNFLQVSIDQNNVATMSSDNDSQGYCELEYVNGKLTIKLYSSVTLDLNTNTITSRGTQRAFNTNYDLMIIRNRILEEDLYHEIVGELSTLNVVAKANFGTPSSSEYNKYRVATDDKYYKCEVVSQTSLGTLLNTNNNYYYNTKTLANNLPSVGLNQDYVIAVKQITPPSNASETYQLADLNTDWYYNAFTGATNLTATSNNRLRFVSYLEATNVPQNPRELYSTQVYGVGALPTPPASANLKVIAVSQRNNTPTSGIQSNYLYSTTVYTPNNLPPLTQYNSVIAVRTMQYPLIVELWRNIGSSWYKYDDLTVSGENVASGKYWQLTDSLGRYYRWNGSGWTMYTGPIDYYLYEYLTGSWVEVSGSKNNLASYNYKIGTTYYTWNGSGFSEYTITYHTANRFGIYNNGSWTFIAPTFSTSYYYSPNAKYYIWNNVSWQEYAMQEKYKEYFVYQGQWEEGRELENNDIYTYGYEYYKWNETSHSWVYDTDFEWVEIGNANQQYFNYDNTLYQYNSTNNQFVQKSSQLQIDREDLLFVIKDMGQADISNNVLSLYINYFTTD